MSTSPTKDRANQLLLIAGAT